MLQASDESANIRAVHKPQEEIPIPRREEGRDNAEFAAAINR
jgi:hypothetical protein